MNPCPCLPRRRPGGRVLKPFGSRKWQLMGRKRSRWLSIPRQATCYVLRRRFPEMSYPTIARLMGGRDHSTIIFAVRQTEARIARDHPLALKVAMLIASPGTLLQHDAHVRDWSAFVESEARRAARFRLAPPPAPSVAAEAESELAEFLDPEKQWCAQCDRSVTPGELARCASQLCSLRAPGSAPEMQFAT
jgi:hypothetical protein